MTTDFRFLVTAEEMVDGTRDLSPWSEWAPTAKAALAQFMARRANKRGFLGIEEIEPMPYAVDRGDGDRVMLSALHGVDIAQALLTLAEQAGCRTIAEARAFLAEIEDAPEAVSKRLIAEWRGEELVQALAVSGAPVRQAAE